METADLLKKVRAIEIKTRGLSNQVFSGEYQAAFKGRGMAFAENREYQHGDEVRTIDWNVTARMGRPFVKVFEEERELIAMILVDVSASENFGTQCQLKRQLIAELTAVLAFSAIQNNDKIGVLLFTDRVEKFIPPKKGKSHILRIIRELLDFTPEGTGTDISMALEYLMRVQKRRAITFVLSDFMDDSFDQALSMARRRHDLVALHVFDRHERDLPDLGLVQFADPETGERKWIDTSRKKVREGYAKARRKWENQLNERLTRCGVDVAHLATGADYVRPLMNLFKQRG